MSEPTVSRVLNGRHGVAERTRARVIQALSELGYTDVPSPGRVSRGAVGIISGELTNPVFSELTQRISERLARHDIVTSIGVASTDLLAEERYVEEFVNVGVDGLIFLTGRHAEFEGDLGIYERLVAQAMPFVLVNGSRTGLPVPHIVSDEEMAAGRAVDHLVSLGHRRIGCVLGTRRYVSAHRFEEGYDRALARHEIQRPDVAMVETAFTFEGGRAGATRLLSNGLTALICGNDLMALGAVQAARSLSLAIPGEVSVVGYDGTDFTATTEPPLTTLRQPFGDMGEMVADAMVSEINGTHRYRDTYLFVAELLARRSTGAHVAMSAVGN